MDFGCQRCKAQMANERLVLVEEETMPNLWPGSKTFLAQTAALWPPGGRLSGQVHRGESCIDRGAAVFVADADRYDLRWPRQPAQAGLAPVGRDFSRRPTREAGRPGPERKTAGLS